MILCLLARGCGSGERRRVPFASEETGPGNPSLAVSEGPGEKVSVVVVGIKRPRYF
jgi:hypothetical protein